MKRSCVRRTQLAAESGQESVLTETVLAKTRPVANLLNAFFKLQDRFFPIFSFHFYFMFEKAGKTEAPHLRISPREPLKQLVANLSLDPAPQAPEHQLHRLSGRSVCDFADKRSKIPSLSHPVNTPQTCTARPILGCTT